MITQMSCWPISQGNVLKSVSSDVPPNFHISLGTNNTLPGITESLPCYMSLPPLATDGHLLMGSSSLTGRYWGGSIWYYSDPAMAPDVEKCRAGFETSSGVADGIFMDNDKLIVVGEVSVVCLVHTFHVQSCQEGVCSRLSQLASVEIL